MLHQLRFPKLQQQRLKLNRQQANRQGQIKLRPTAQMGAPKRTHKKK
jgi:hypothetical protein